jgi:4a-hydroxytetrahydrobiopterin dehydratase
MVAIGPDAQTEATMTQATTDGITAREFHATEGTEDWRVVGDGAHARYLIGSFTAGTRFAAAIGAVEGVDDHGPDVDIRRDAITVRLLTSGDDWYGMSRLDVDLARRIAVIAREQGLVPDPSAVQSVLIVPGAARTADVMPFWQAALGYVPRPDSPDEDLVDPHDRSPAFWFEAMDEPRQGGGAIRVAVWRPYEQAEARVGAALAAGGHLVRDSRAPAWWTLADADGNEVDIATVKERD